MKNLFFFSLLCLLFTACDPRIKITTEYITNSDWKNELRRKDMEYWRITKIYPVSDKINPKSEKWDYRVDSLFIYSIAPDTLQLEVDTIYFDRAQPGNKWYKNGGCCDKVDSIGELQPDSWYRFYNVEHSVSHYVYVDKNKKVKVYRISHVSLFV